MAMRFTLEVEYRILPILIVDYPERGGVPLGLQRDLDWGWIFILFAISATHPAIDAIAGGTKRGRVTVSKGCNNIVVSPKCQAKRQISVAKEFAFVTSPFHFLLRCLHER